MSEQRTASDWDKRIIDAVSISLDGLIGGKDDIARLRKQIEDGRSEDKLNTACEVAVAFIRWAQDLKADRSAALNAAEESKRLALELPKHIKRACSYESEAGRHVYWPSDDGSGGYLPPHWLRAIADHLDELDAEYQLTKGESDGLQELRS